MDIISWFHSLFAFFFLKRTNYLEYLLTLRLPDQHWPYFFYNNPTYRQLCVEDDKCPYQAAANITDRCWGYEDVCPPSNRMINPQCPGEEYREAYDMTYEEHLQDFWEKGDFGYIKDRRNEMDTYCQPPKSSQPGGSSLECVEHLCYCRARNLYLDFRTADLQDSYERFRTDVFQRGELGGYCKMRRKALLKQGDHNDSLQSWIGELQHYRGLKFDPFDDVKKHCDVVLDKPTYIMKLDWGGNMFHHFCDFINLYMSLHMNNTFSLDNHIIMWDTSAQDYFDYFHQTWRAFTYANNYIHLNEYDGKKICIRDAVFTLLPRMRNDHFYNMMLIYGCTDTALYKSFSELVLHRLNITQGGPLEGKIRITLLARQTQHRNILNQDEIVRALTAVPEYRVRVVHYDWIDMPFLHQLRRTHNSEIFMGLHGAGLTHGLFLPDWGCLFELYHCDDENCYKDIARLRGVNYQTWEDMSTLYPENEGYHPQLKAPHKKFTNYSFDVTELLRLVKKNVDLIKKHPAYIKALKTKQEERVKKEQLKKEKKRKMYRDL